MSIEHLADKQQVIVDGSLRFLRPNANNLLIFLLRIRHPDLLVSVPEIKQAVWGSSYVSESSVRLLIFELKGKIAPYVIHNERGLGYQILDPGQLTSLGRLRLSAPRKRRLEWQMCRIAKIQSQLVHKMTCLDSDCIELAEETFE